MFHESNAASHREAKPASDSAPGSDGFLFRVPPEQREVCGVAARALRAVMGEDRWGPDEVLRFAAVALLSDNHDACCGFPMSPAWAARDGLYTLVVYRCRHCGRVMDTLRATLSL